MPKSVSMVWTGSSPRGRGKLAGTGALTEDLGLIPARAGKTRSRAKPSSEYRAHPRAGGENTAQKHFRRLKHGSSPRGRGKLFPAIASRADEGLIPARAGKT